MKQHFKRSAAWFLCFALLIGLVSGVAGVVNHVHAEENDPKVETIVAENNLLGNYNNSFEDYSILGWNFQSGVALSKEQTNAGSTYSLKINVKDAFATSDAAPARVAWPYTASVQVLGEGKISIVYYDAEKAVISESAASVSAASDAWQTLSVTATAPAKTAYAAVKLSAATANAVYFDDVSLIADDLNDELTIPNGDFAERLNGWEHVSSKPAGTTYSFVKEESNIYAKIDVNASKFDYTSLKVEVTPGMYYVFSLDVKNTDGLWNALYVEFFDDKDATSSKRIGSASQVGNQIASDEWTTISVQAKAPEGAKYAWIRMHANVNQTGTLSIDNARVAYNNDWYNGEMEGSYTNIGLPMGYTRSSDVVDEYTTKDPACVYAGEQAFYIDNNTWYYTYYMNVVPGETYNSTYYLKTSEEAASGWKGPLYNRIYFYDAAGKQISQLDKTTTKVTAQWTTLTNTQVAPEGAAYARVMFLSNQSKLVYVDNGTFVRTSYTNLVKTNANFDSPLTVVGCSTIPNWTLNVSAETEVVYDSPEHGYVGHIKDYGRQVWIYSQRFPVTAGDKYTASALLNGVAGYAQLYIRFYKDATGNAYVSAPENRGYASTDYLTAEDGWVPLDDYNSYIKDGKITLTTPEGATYVGILIVLQPLKDEAGEYTDVEMSIDEISLIKVCDHDFTGEPEATEASCTADGIAVYTCPDCGATKTIRTSALAHTYVDGVCSGCGRIDIQQVVSELPALGVVAGLKEYVGREWKTILDLPATVDVALSNGQTVAVAVEWDYAPLGDLTEEGRYVLTGKLVDHEYANAENLTAQQVIYITEKNNMFINGDAENGKTGWAGGHSLTNIEYPAGSGNHVLKAYSASIVNGRQFFYQSSDQQTAMAERLAEYGYGKYLISFNIMAGDYDASTPAREDLSFIFTQRYYKPGATSSTVALKSYTLSVAPGEWTSFAQMYDVTSDWTKLLTEFKVSTSNAGVPAAYYIDNIEMIPLRVVLNDLPVNIESVQTETTPLQIVVGYDKYVGANWQEALGLIEEATVIGADGGSATATITWDYAPLGDLTTLGKYVIEGKLSSDTYTNYNDVTIKQTIVIVNKVNLVTNGNFANALTGWTGGWSKSVVEYEAGNNVLFAKKASITAGSGGTQIVSSADTADLADRIAVNGQYYIAVDAISAPYDANSAARDDLKVWIDLRKDSNDSTVSFAGSERIAINADSWITIGKVFEINNAADWALARIDFKAQAGVADQPGAIYLDNAELFLLKGEYVEVPECQHTATETVKENEIAADCTNAGSYDLVVYCATCGEELSRESFTVDAVGHAYDADVTAPTCTTAGYTTYTCSVCDHSYTADEVAALGHAWDNGVIDPDATCTVDGVKTYTCGTCGETKTEAVSAKGHTAADAVTENITNATCTADGSYDTVVYCSVCNAELSRKTTVVPATGHAYDADVTAPTCTTAGYTTYTCSVCGYSYTADEVAALGHTAKEAVKENIIAADCTNAGSYDLVVYCATCGEELSRESFTVNAIGHAYDADVTAPTCTTAGYTTYTCSVCDHSYTADEVAALGHAWNDGVIDPAPTCTAEGVKTYTCGTCGETKTEAVSAKGHTAADAVTENITNATCTADGSYDTVVYCSVCNAELSRKTTVVPATGHAYDADVTAPTCTTAGYTTYTCSVCDHSYTADEVAALGHTAKEAVKENIIAADCTNAGSYDLVVYCATCGEELSRESFTVNAIGHAFDADVTAPTCTTAGYTTYTCSVCDHSYTADEVAALGHDYTSQITKQPTLNEEGIETFTCTVCGDSYTKPVAKLEGAVAEINGYKYATLAEAVAAAQADDTIVLLQDVVLEDTLTIAAGKVITLDLNGKTISQVKNQTAAYQMILNDGTLTINDSVGTGKISYTDSGVGGDYISDTIYNRGVLVINGGTIENLSSATVAFNGYPHAVDTYSGIRNTSVTINGGTIYCAEYSAIRMFCTSATNKADLVINGGTIQGAIDMQNGAAAATLGSLTITGGTFETTANVNNIRFANWNGGAKEYGITASITGGNFNGGINTAYVPAAANWNSKIISGGTYAQDMTAYCVDGYHTEANAEGKYVLSSHEYDADVTAPTCTTAGYTTYTCACGHSYVADETEALGHDYTSQITKQPTLNEEGIETFTCTVCGDSYTKPVAKLEGAVAEVNGYKYATFAEAWAAVKAGDTIKLLEDITLNSTLLIDKAITFDGNGKTLTYTGVGADARAINVNALGNVVIENLTIKAEKAQRAVNVIQKAVNLTLNNVDAEADNYAVNIASSAGAAKVTIINSDLVGLNTVNIASAGAVVVITDSNILCDDQTNVENYGAITINKAGVGAKVTVTGGSITAMNGSQAVANSAEGASVLISESTAVSGSTDQIVAIIVYDANYYYAFTSIEAAAYKAKAGETIILLADCEGNAILAAGAKLDLNGKTFKGNIVGTVEMNNGTWITPDKDYVMAGPDADYYITTNAVLTIDVSGNITVEEGTLTLAQSWWTGAGQTLTIAEDATFVIPAGMNLNVLSTVIVEGTAVVEGTVTLYTADATITAAADLNVITIVKDAKVVYANGTYTVHVHAWSDATCTTPATCDCGDTKGEALGHTAKEAVKENEVAADCVSAGSYDLVVYCATCGEELSRESFTVNAIGHVYDADVTAPTCTTAGYTTYTCSVCGDSYTADEVAALGHILVITTPMQRPTCTEPGNTIGMECVTCGYVSAPQVWPASGHIYDSVTDPDCNVCGASQVVLDLRLEFVGTPGLSFQDYVGMQALVSNSMAGKYDSIYVEAVQVGPNGTTRVILEAEPYFGVYQLFNHQVLSWSMTEEVSLTLYGMKDGITYQGQTISASVEELAMAKLAAYAEAENAKAVTALVDMLNYGAAVQTAFNYNVAKLPNTQLGDYVGTAATPEFNATNTITGEGAVAALKDSISMQAKVEIQLLFADDISAYTAKATVGGVDADVVIDTETMSAYGWTIVRVAVGAAKMRDTYTIALYDADGNAVTQTYEVSVEAYAQAQLNSDYDDVVVAMMRYGDAVSALLAPQE